MRHRLRTLIVVGTIAALGACTSARDLSTATTGPSGSPTTATTTTTNMAVPIVVSSTTTAALIEPAATTAPSPASDPGASVTTAMASDATQPPLTTSAAAPTATPAAPAIVISAVGVLGWWDGAAWIDSDATTANIPVANGVDFSVLALDGRTQHAVSTSVTSGCEPAGTYTVVLDPSILAASPDHSDVAVNATWSLQPRPVGFLDGSNVDYLAVIRDRLAGEGLASAEVKIDQLIRSDLDGNGTDEVIVVASHPDLDTGVGARAGWYSIALLRQVVGGGVRTTVLGRDIHREADVDYPTSGRYAVDAIADLNGDGRAEIVLQVSHFEDVGVSVFEVSPDAGPHEVLTGGCGS